MKELLISLVVFAVVFFLHRKVKSISESVYSKLDPEVRGYASVLFSIFNIALLALGVIVWLGAIGIDVTSVLTGLGLLGFAVGFALKDVVSNLISGIMILVFKPFKVGDLVEVKGFKGKVSLINLRYTELEDEKGKILIPNSVVFKEAVRLFEKKSPQA